MNRTLLACAALAAAACGSLDHSNPYDPSTPPALQARARLTGQVALEAGATPPSLSGVHVSIPGTSLSADTDATGAYAIADVPPGSYAVQAVRTGWDDTLVSGVVVLLDDGGKDVVVPLLALPLSRGQLSGSVALEHELQSGGVSISLSGIPGSVTTDTAGAFLIAGVPVGTYTLTASKVGFVETSVTSVAVQKGAVTDLAPVALPYDPGAFAGTISVQGAASSGGVTVRASGTTLNGSPYEATTVNRADGTYLFSGLPAGTYNVSFELANYATVSTSGAVAPHATTTLAPVSLVRDTGSVTGVATLRLSTDHTGIQVTLTPRPTAADPTPSAAAAAVTSSSGSWRVDGLAVGDYDVAYSKQPGYQPASGLVTVVSHAVTAAAQVELADIPGQVQGRVLLEGRAAGALDGTSVHEQSGAPVLTAADGSYTLQVSSGARTIVFDRTGYDTQRVQVAVSPGVILALADVTLAVSRGAISGTFRLSGPAGLSSAGVVVTAALSGGTFTASTVADSTGAFQLTGLPVGTYTVTGRKDPDWQPQAVAGVVVAAAATTSLPGSPVSLQPATTASIGGTVLLEGAATHAGTTVTLSGTDFRGEAVGPLTTTTAPSGAWSFSGLAAGSYQVLYAQAHHDAPAPTGASLSTGQALSLGTATLPVSTGAVTGTVALSAGAAAGFPVGSDRSGAVVTLTAPDGTVRSTVTDASGAWSFDGVPVALTGGAHAVVARRASYQPASGAVTVAAHATTAASLLTLALDVGSLAGTVTLWDNAGGGGANGSSAGATVSLVGTAFNGAAWSASTTTAADGSFTAASLPPGSYDVTAASAGRTCAAFDRATVPAGTAAAAGSVLCVDAVAPGAVSLGAPDAPSGGLSGYTAASSVVVSIVEPTDATGNLRGYQLVVGSAADWSAATLVPTPQANLTFTGLASNATNQLWVRAVDWAGNAGPVATAQVIQDGLMPPAPAVSTPRPVVDATTTSVTLSGSDSDANFGGYEICTLSQAATADCGASAPGGCTWAGTSPNFALSLPAGQRTCLYARAWDRAGTRSGETSLGVGGVVSDLVPPTPPGFVPSFDPNLVTVRAPWVEFFLDTPSTDQPSGLLAWEGVAWVEVDSGAGFEPLCPATACHPGGVYSPCAAGCGCAATDRRLLCDGTRFTGVRVPLREGSSNDVAFRAVDLAGNVGSGVGQQVRADSSGDVIAGTVAIDASPVVRGNLVTFDSWIPGAGNPHGVILELGPDRRAQATDLRCDVPGSVASGYGRGIVPASPELILVANNSGVMLRPAVDGHYCSAAGAWQGTATTFRTPAAGFFVRGVSGVGELATWWEDDNASATANLYAREAGADRTFGNGDDVATLVATFNYVETITTGERATLVKHASCGLACYTYAWRIYNANASGGYASGVTTWNLPAAATTAALSPDGRQAAWWEPAAAAIPQRLWVRGSGSNDAFEAGGDDAAAFVDVPDAWGVPARTTTAESSVAVDGTHVVALLRTDSLNTIAHWWAGPDGTWGNADDTLERIHPTAGTWGTASLAAGYAVFGEASNIRAVDLSYLRWEAAPAAGLSSGMSLAADGTGQLLYRTSANQLRARTLAGADLAGFTHSGLFDAQGTHLLTAENDLLVLRQPGTSGTWFTTGAPAPVTLFTGTGNGFTSLALGGGKGIAVERMTGGYRYRILEPRGGTLATLPSTGAVVDALGIDQGWAFAAGITAAQAFYSCHGITVDTCVHNAGPDGWFGTGDDTTITLLHPSGSPRAGAAVHDARAFKVAGNLMLFAEFSPPALYLFHAGPDGRFGSSDDRGRKLADGYFSPYDIALAGRNVAYVAEGSPMGAQIWLVVGFEGTPTLVTGYVSPKTSPALEPSGRVFWSDSVFAPEAVFVRAP